MNRIVLLFLSSLLISCSHLSPLYWGWGEWAEADVSGVETNSIAKLDWSRLPGVITAIDGIRAGSGYKKAKLLSGRHVIEYAYYPAQFGTHPKGVVNLDLKAGHVYRFEIKLCFWCMPRKYAVWVDDNTTGEVVWGKRPDWPSWWL